MFLQQNKTVIFKYNLNGGYYNLNGGYYEFKQIFKKK